MKRTAVVFALVVVSFAIFLPFSFSLQTVRAQNAGYSIQHVDHKVEVLYSGHVVISDTIQLSGQLPDSFMIGFPYRYGSYVLEGVAYDSNSNALQMTLGVQLQDQSGYYGTKVSLPAGSSEVFTVVFIFSNDLLTSTPTGFSLDFPAYPSFVQTAAECNATLSLPSDVATIGVDKNDGAISATYTNSISYVKTNLAAFTYSPATATFSIPDGSVKLVNIESLNREITYNPQGETTCLDTYRITNKESGYLIFFRLNVPISASNIIVRDQFGRVLYVNALSQNSESLAINVTFILPMRQNESVSLTVGYDVPRTAPEQPTLFVLNPSLFPWMYYYIREASVTFIPPEGARFVAPKLSSAGLSFSLFRDAFQEKVSVSREGVSFVDHAIPSESTLQLEFEYSPLWIAFRPTSWVWAIAVFGCIIVALWMRPKAKAPSRIVVPKLVVGLSPENVKVFTDAYEERNRITSDLRSLEARAQRGRIPRRRYKVQRRTWELRLGTLSQTIAELKEVLRSAGGSYADAVKQLEIAEVELEEVELGVKTIEARHARGELPLEAYKKQLADYERRKEKAETTVNGLLLRLRGEIR